MHDHEHSPPGEQASGQRLKRGREERQQNRKRLAWTLVLIVGYMVAEVVGGLLTNSLALLADACHMLGDAFALGLSLFAIWITQWSPTALRSYGFVPVTR